ncbi:MAG: zinc ribbon domain-containing protein [Frankiaceae bacterium]|nr:zinc ribbon domain-containing protein [Frankiaceae bacterium]MBV9870724.1 zinc ribbon domain-containing protein [Frankiaceae bacterium]
MASYDYRCRECDQVFTVQRAMSDVAMLVRCPAGHEDVARVWSAVAVTGAAAAPAPAGGCCGGGCCG